MGIMAIAGFLLIAFSVAMTSSKNNDSKVAH
jgi:hypothetical protein